MEGFILIVQVIPISQLLPAYPERQMHSFGRLQYPPVEAVKHHMIIRDL